MNTRDQLRQAIDQEQSRLMASVPADRPAAIMALLRVQDRLRHPSSSEPEPDLIARHRLANPGGNKALHLCFAATGEDAAGALSGGALDSWAEGFRDACARLAAAEMVMTHVETGFMRIGTGSDGTFQAWITTKQAPTSWRERADFDWWRTWLARKHEPELRARQSVMAGGERGAQDSRNVQQLAGVYLEMMANQIGYPPDAVIAGCTIQIYRAVLHWLIARALQRRERGETAGPESEPELASAMATDIAIDPGLAGRALAAFTLDRENAAYHAAVPGIATPPLVRVSPKRVVSSVYGLTTEPLLFLTRELKRRHTQEYHNSAYTRETVFRQDLYALFPDKRFITSAGRVELRRESGDVRTDVDAVIFDRKTGACGLFELKSQDPFASSAAELTRQRDNVLFANRQISGFLTWLQRYGGDDLLNRVDNRAARRFRVQKVYPFVLGRYLAHFSDGAPPDRRAAWGTWPELLRLRAGEPFQASDANPLASLFTRLGKDTPRVVLPADAAPRKITVGDLRLVVYPAYAAFQRAGG